MTYTESKKKIDEIRNKVGEAMFRMAISHLMDVGIRHLDEANIRLTCHAINKEDDSKSFMTNEFKCEIVRMAGELAQIEHIHLLNYISKEVYYDVNDGCISYQRAFKIAESCLDWITSNDIDSDDILCHLRMLDLTDEEIVEFGYEWVLDKEEEE